MTRQTVYDLDGNDFDRISTDLDDIIEPAIEHQLSTTDYPRLCEWSSHYVFVYDGMKSGFRRDHHLQDYSPVAVGWTKQPFRLYRTKSPAILPVMILDPEKGMSAPVYGEVYQVSPRTIRSLDWLNSNGFQTKRLRMPVNAIIDKKGTQKQIYAFCYPHLQSYWSSRMDRLLPCDILTANNNKQRYYNYMKKYEQTGSE